MKTFLFSLLYRLYHFFKRKSHPVLPAVSSNFDSLFFEAAKVKENEIKQKQKEAEEFKEKAKLQERLLLEEKRKKKLQPVSPEYFEIAFRKMGSNLIDYPNSDYMTISIYDLDLTNKEHEWEAFREQFEALLLSKKIEVLPDAYISSFYYIHISIPSLRKYYKKHSQELIKINSISTGAYR